MSIEKYRGWEIHHSNDSFAVWAGYEFDAYFGGVDLDAPRIAGRTLDEVKAEIDDHDLTEVAQ